jgi:hypothetical protein
VAYPIFFLLYFFEAVLFIGETNWKVNLVWSPIRLLFSLVPPIVYVVLPGAIAWSFYLLVLETNSTSIAIGSSIVIFGFIFFLTCFRVRRISHDHPWGYTLKPRERYQEVIKEAAVWISGLALTLIWFCTVSGIYTFFTKRKPNFIDGKAYLIYVSISIWSEILFLFDSFLTVFVYSQIWRLGYLNVEIEKIKVRHKNATDAEER